jgi:hypothetical protein
MKMVFLVAIAIVSTFISRTRAEEITYQRHGAKSDLFQVGMKCQAESDFRYQCESLNKTVFIGENNWQQSREHAPLACVAIKK